MYMSFFYIITIIESMIDTNSMRDDIKNVISQGVIGGTKKTIKKTVKKNLKSPKSSSKSSPKSSPKSSSKSSSKSPSKSLSKSSPKSLSKSSYESNKKPYGYIWKYSNINGVITREAHPIYNMIEARKMMHDRMHRIFQNLHF